jgi:ketosteroid isomerase-like protein
MKKELFAFLLMLVFVINPVTNRSMAQSIPSNLQSTDKSFNAFLVEWEQAYNAFINGDAVAWKNVCSKANDATILGGFGGFEKGWKELGPRYDWAAAQFSKSGAKLKVEYISIVVSGNLAYMILMERADVLIHNMKPVIPHLLRSTQIFRKEEGRWRLLHRHADYQIEKKSPATGNATEQSQ